MLHQSGAPGAQARRTPLHTRVITYRGYSRDDGLWDIEGHLLDKKDYLALSPDGDQVPAGMPVHEMVVRVTINDDFIIQDVEASMPNTPFSDCAGAAAPLSSLVGATLGSGWRKVIDARIGGTKSCTHLRELLLNLATAAIQTITPYRAQFGQGEAFAAQGAAGGHKPFYIDQCLAWRSNGAVVRRLHPQYAPPGPATAPETL